MKPDCMIDKRQLVGCIVDVWYTEEELLIESCAVRARIKEIRDESGTTVFHLAPFRIWAARSRVWCSHIQGDNVKDFTLNSCSRSEPEGIYSCSFLFPSMALQLALPNARIAVIYPKSAVSPLEPDHFLLREKRAPAAFF